MTEEDEGAGDCTVDEPAQSIDVLFKMAEGRRVLSLRKAESGQVRGKNPEPLAQSRQDVDPRRCRRTKTVNQHESLGRRRGSHFIVVQQGSRDLDPFALNSPLKQMMADNSMKQRYQHTLEKKFLYDIVRHFEPEEKAAPFPIRSV